MPLYRWNTDNLESVAPTKFEAAGLQEADLQNLLRDQPEVLEEGLFIVAEEFSNWRDSNRSIDLLALDKEGNLVVVELKRTQSGDHSELQAIRYAAMVSNITLEEILDAHRAYLAKRGDDGNARIRVLRHLGAADEADLELRTGRPRIILASAGFSTELTTSVLWLREGGVDITCIKLQLYSNGDDLLMDTSQVIPLPEAADYLVKIGGNAEGGSRQRSQPRTTRGSDIFRNRIGDMPQSDQPVLNSLLDWALSLEEEGLARAYTRQGSTHTVLRLNLTNAFVRLVNIYISPNDYSLEVWGRVWNRYAPNSIGRLEEAISPIPLGDNGTYLTRWSVELLDALTDAYREANGLAITLPPGNDPGSPAMAER